SLPEFMSVFISYSTNDENFAKKLYTALKSYKVDVWFAPHDMKGGRLIYEQVSRAIDERDKILLILSESSMSSNWVASEISAAFEAETLARKRKLFPISIVDYKDIESWKMFDADIGSDVAK